MMVGFISDTHGSALAWRRAMNHGLSSCELIIHCGDVLYHGPRNPLPDGHDPQALAGLINASSQRIHLAKGNCDAAIDQQLLDYPLGSPAIVVEAAGVGILAHHGDLLSEDETRRFARASAVSLIASGHTHLRVLERAGGVVYLNPGSCSLPKSADARPSFGVFDGRAIRLLDVTDGTVLEELHL